MLEKVLNIKMADNPSCVFENAKKVEIFEDGSIISPMQLFEEVYDGLDSLLFYNRVLRTSIGGLKASVAVTRKAYISKWLKDLNNVDLRVKVHYDLQDQEKSIDYKVLPRTNLQEDRERRPSIVHLRDEDGNSLCFRKAEHYSPHSNRMDMVYIEHSCRETNDPRTMLKSPVEASPINQKWNESFYDGNLWKGLGHSKKRVVYLPEPHLLAILEQMYAEGLLPRVTPQVKVVDVNDKNVFTIRPMLNAVVDMGMGDDLMRGIGNYLGTLHALGLYDDADRQMIHYVIQSGDKKDAGVSVVNFDPDLMVLDRRRPTERISAMAHDRTKFKKQLKDKMPLLGKRAYGLIDSSRKKTIDSLVEKFKLEGQKVGNEIYKRLQTDLQEYSVWDDLSIELN